MPSTYTYSTTRTEAVVDQFDIFLRYAGISESKRTRIVHAVENRWLVAVGVYVRDTADRRVLEAEVAINWSAHSDHAVLTPTVANDLPGWEDGGSPEVTVIGNRFGRRAKELGGNTSFWVRFAPAIRADVARYKRLCSEVGVSHGSSVPPWKSTPNSRSLSLVDLPEMSVSLREA